ncbi:peptidoglycan-binding protein [Streptomyces sp. NPDC051909]|uniref:peptidoglycan-binding domain-containing protein n=1 Tax=Streptomyces sp. NPDC051909 TaxID=3154944 RepID=UPI0034478B45
MAAAEDFDPLRIRPYVTLADGRPGDGLGDETAVLPPVAPPPAPPTPPMAPPMAPPVAPVPLAGPLPPEAAPEVSGASEVSEASEVPQAVAAGSGGGPETMRLLLPGTAPELVYEGGALYGYEAGPGYDPEYPDEGPVHTLAYAPEGRGRRGRGRGRARTGVIAGVVAVAVVGTAALAAALIGGDETDDRAGVPEVTTSASDNVAVSEAPTPTPSESASTSATPSPTATGSPSPAATRAKPTATAPAAPPRTATATPTRPSSAPSTAATLRIGSSGADVKDLQLRLRQLGLYSGPINGEYGRKVEHGVEVFQSYMYIEEDPKGVYGPSTRTALEGATSNRDGSSGDGSSGDGGWGGGGWG